MHATSLPRFRDYEVVRLLGKGATGSVFEARHAQLGHAVAIKVMHPELAADRAYAERFLRGGRNAARIQHPNVARTYDVGSREGVPYLVMELVGEETLASALRRSGPMSLAELADVFLPIVSAVSAAHELGIVHRDLKPANIALTTDRAGGARPSLLDFGTSRVATLEEGTLEATRSDALLGTLPYMAPEQVRGAGNADERSDQYALGVMLYECATGTRPFAAGAAFDLMNAIVSAPVVAPSARRAGLPLELDAIVMRAMHRDPDARFASVAELGVELLRFAGPRARALWGDAAEGDGAALARDSKPLAQRGGARRGLGWVAALVAVVPLASIVLLSVARRGDAVEPPRGTTASVSSPIAAGPSVLPALVETASPPAEAATHAERTSVPIRPRSAPPPLAGRASAATQHGGAATAPPASSPPPLGTNLAPILE
jgi:hypothetical protein